MKKFLIISAIAVIAACNLIRDETQDNHYFHTGYFNNDGQRR